MSKKIAVIGGGAAGMMAAATAAANGHQVMLFEKNEKLGKKVFITGKGRCNVTNACEIEDLFGNIITNSKFLYSAIYGYDNQAICSFLEEAGCRLKTERGDRVFPVTDHSSDVIRAFEKVLKERGVRIYLQTRVKEIIRDALTGRVDGVLLHDGKKISADCVILATGGLSYASTGSDGEGMKMAEKLGHSCMECVPALVPFEIEETWCTSLMGLALKNVEGKLFVDGKEIYSGFGEMLFTHFGISGPLVLSASSYYASAMRKRKNKKKDQTAKAKYYLDLKPALSFEQLDKRILREFEENINKQFKNAVDGLFPSKLIPVMISLSGIDPEKKVNEISREERHAFVHLIKNLPMTITGTRDFKEAIITQGGIAVKEVNPSTMESKLVQGLYFAGEILDVDALTGGFNLQIAWSTGHLAGESC